MSLDASEANAVIPKDGAVIPEGGNATNAVRLSGQCFA